MSEAIAVISIIANIIALIDFSVEIYDRATSFSNAKDIPKAFRDIRNVLPSISSSLQQSQKDADSGEADEHAFGVLKDCLDGLKETVVELKDIFQKVMPADGASRLTRGWKAVLSMRLDKKVDRLDRALSRYVDVLALYHVSKRRKKWEPTRRPLFMIRYQKEENFIGREDVMKEVAKRFEDKFPRVAITGIGGVGKSRIAIEYCYQYRAETPDAMILWVHGGSRSRFEAAYKDIAAKLKIPGFDDSHIDTITLVSDYLSKEESGPWLMILDNADSADIWVGPTSGSADIPLANHLPRGTHGSILITTRDAQLGRMISNVGRPRSPILILSFSSNDAISLLRSKISIDKDVAEPDAQDLTKALNHLPLAITQAAAYLDQNDMSVSNYLRLIETSDLLSREIYDDSRDPAIQNSVFKTWSISFNTILEQWPRAGEMLSLMAMFDRQRIPIQLLANTNEDDLIFNEAVTKLKAFSLIDEESKSKTYSMHRIVQLSVNWYLKSQGNLLQWREIALACIERSYPIDGDYENWALIESLNPHTQMVLSYSFTARSSQLQYATLNHILGRYYTTQRRYPTAVKHFFHALKLREDLLGPEDIDTLYSMAYAAWNIFCDGDLDKSESLIQRALQIFGKTSLGKATNDRAVRLHVEMLETMASVLGKRGQYQEAEEIFNQARALSLLCPADPLLNLGVMLSHGSLYADEGKFAEAEGLLRRVLDMSMDLKQIEHSRTLIPPLVARHRLGSILYQMEKYSQAEESFRYTLVARLDILGHAHTDTLITRQCLADTLEKLQRHDEAKVVRESVHRIGVTVDPKAEFET